ncbi:MAG: ATP-dependent DNA helicase RecG [Clostridia bacterium]|nr:ATP-dependent DNA helicase RecG [Clostridia bacterium]
MSFNPDMDIKYVKLVGEKRAKLFNRLDVYTAGQLLRLFPRTYIDFSASVSIAGAKIGEYCCVKAVVDRTPTGVMIRKGMTIFKTAVTDGESVMELVIFNNKYLAESLEQGREYYFYGKVTAPMGRLQMDSPVVEKADAPAGLRPVYPLTAGLTSRGVANVMKNALELYKNNESEDIIPEQIRHEYNLCSSRYAYINIHFPSCRADMLAARKRLIFEELLCLQLGMSRLRGAKEKTGFVISRDVKSEFMSSLPFLPTAAQVRAVSDCISDMMSGERMNRLLQGDVGSGKTAVAAAVMYCAVKNGMQCAMMAPTEILARQHLESLLKFFEGTGITAELLTSSTPAKEKRRIKASLAAGETDIAVGTHALIQDDVEFSRLGLVITDEQHRFGVGQRSALSEKGSSPHVLVMSATPIPRTLAMIVYGDLDISVLDELPPGRQKVDTYCVDSTYHQRLYAFIKKHLDRGLQAYIVCPLVAEGEETPLTSAEEYYEKLSENEFSSYSVGLLHGKMKPKMKDEVMERFVKNEIQLLICTTVVEVGVDVPNAAVMLIENAERFGLSQLHQLRGRVGRGKEKSTCVLITDAKGEQTKKRAEIMCSTNDGFVIADEDLKLRGPGDFFGSRQHGLPTLRIADMLEDTEMLRKAKQAAEKILSDDPQLSDRKNEGLKREIRRLFDSVGSI